MATTCRDMSGWIWNTVINPLVPWRICCLFYKDYCWLLTIRYKNVIVIFSDGKYIDCLSLTYATSKPHSKYVLIMSSHESSNSNNEGVQSVFHNLYISVYHFPLYYLIRCYSVGIFRQTQLFNLLVSLFVYLATCFGHLFGHLQGILEGVYFLYYIITLISILQLDLS
jgi:hypothetical protein